MPPVIATTIVKDGAGNNISSGVQTLEFTGNQTTGPFNFINALVDGATQTTLASVKKASVTALSTDPALVVGFNPLSNTVQVGSSSTTVGIKGANLSAVAADPALVVALSPNNINPNGATTAANSAPVALPTNQIVSTSLTQVGGTAITMGQAVMATSIPVVIASNQASVAVLPPLTIATAVTPTLSTTTAYTSTQVIGGILTFTAVLGTTTSGIIESITAKFYSTVSTTGLSVAIFKASPAGTFTDHVAAAIATADTAQLLGIYHLSTALSDLGNHTIYNLDGIAKAVNAATSTLFGVVTSLGTTAAMGSTTCFTLEVSVLPG